MLTVGRVAQQTRLTRRSYACTRSTRLIAPPARTASGYRTYQPEDLPVLRFIRQAQALGMTRKEIKAVLDVRRNGRSPCALVCLLDRLLAETERRIAESRELRDALRAARALADPPAGNTQQRSRGDLPDHRRDSPPPGTAHAARHTAAGIGTDLTERLTTRGGIYTPWGYSRSGDGPPLRRGHT
ncbi:MerR family DNA-binding protein [Streptomyces sp. NPDC048279]|uniref:MerR family DNA-binding protein n=1 Tax=Streptomyces sp. NPDC048279 TaxID=3154714 RepID=UPI0034491964